MGDRVGRPCIPTLGWMQTFVATPMENQPRGEICSWMCASRQASIDPTVVGQRTHTPSVCRLHISVPDTFCASLCLFRRLVSRAGAIQRIQTFVLSHASALRLLRPPLRPPLPRAPAT
eukprot:2292577-Rhodomonas_salina.2